MCTHTHLGVRKQVSVHAYKEHFGRKPKHKKSVGVGLIYESGPTAPICFACLSPYAMARVVALLLGFILQVLRRHAPDLVAMCGCSFPLDVRA